MLLCLSIELDNKKGSISLYFLSCYPFMTFNFYEYNLLYYIQMVLSNLNSNIYYAITRLK